MGQKLLQRYKDGDRMNHWFIVIMFILAGLSGLAFFHPSLFFLSNFFGGGSWARILHPFMGVLMTLGFLLLFMKLWKDNIITQADREWASKAGEMFKGNKSAMPPVGKYNFGQKAVFWLMAISLLVLLVTGIMFWRPWFAPYFSIPVMRIAVLLHSVSAVVLILTTIVHVYAAIWVKGTIGAMRTGLVSHAWARKHHPGWFKEMTGGK